MENLKIYDLTVNYLKNPCGIDTVPRFSFKAQSGIRGDKLAEFTVTVSANPDFSSPVWQRHFGSEDGSVLIRYEGEALSPVTRYYFPLRQRVRRVPRAKTKAVHSSRANSLNAGAENG